MWNDTACVVRKVRVCARSGCMCYALILINFCGLTMAGMCDGHFWSWSEKWKEYCYLFQREFGHKKGGSVPSLLLRQPYEHFINVDCFGSELRTLKRLPSAECQNVSNEYASIEPSIILQSLFSLTQSFQFNTVIIPLNKNKNTASTAFEPRPPRLCY